MSNEDDDCILVVDDDEHLRLLCTRQLAKLGYKAHLAINGREAVALFEQFSYRLILMDVIMPDMDGFDATRAIRELENTLQRVRTPIIAMTAYPDPQRCYAEGLDDCLAKPFLLNDLREKINAWLAVGKAQSI